jgi:YegS/Rv2252/BmrU family lipid kinase
VTADGAEAPATQVLAIVRNPTKFDDPAQAATDVETAFAEHGLPAPRWYETTADDPGQGQTLAAVEDGADLVIAQGGDGTVRACAAALAGGDVPLGLLPAGTGNLLARNIGVPRDLGAAVATLAAGMRRNIDLVELDGEPFVVMGGSGFDAQLFADTSEKLKDSIGWGAYVVSGLRTLRRARAHAVVVDIDGTVTRTRAVGVVVGNVGTLTGGIELLPHAEAQDGRLHVAVLTPVSAWHWAGLALRLLVRRDPHPVQMTVMRGSRATITWAQAVPVEIDGDLVEPRRLLTFLVRPGRVTVCAPNDTEQP